MFSVTTPSHDTVLLSVGCPITAIVTVPGDNGSPPSVSVTETVNRSPLVEGATIVKENWDPFVSSVNIDADEPTTFTAKSLASPSDAPLLSVTVIVHVTVPSIRIASVSHANDERDVGLPLTSISTVFSAGPVDKDSNTWNVWIVCGASTVN